MKLEGKGFSNLRGLVDTKQKKIVAIGAIGSVVVLGSVGIYALAKTEDALKLKEDVVNVEYGSVVSLEPKDYLDSPSKSVLKGTKVTSTVKNEEGKEYPATGDYKIVFKYKNDVVSVKVTVADTTKPKLEVPETIDVLQNTDLSTFDFGSLFKVTDYSDVGTFDIDISKVDVTTVGTYDMKVSIKDSKGNKASKKVVINVVTPPDVGEGEVAVTEFVTDENGNVKTVVTKKSKDQLTDKDKTASSGPISNNGSVSVPSDGSSSKPSKPSDGGSNKPSDGGNSNSGGTNKPDEHKHSYVPQYKTVHHDAETKVVHHEEQGHYETKVVKEAWDEPIYAKRHVCKVCSEVFDNADSAIAHSAITGHSYTYKNIQVGTKHHDAVTEQVWVVDKAAWDETVVVKEAWDEKVLTSYKCSCGATK